MCVCSDRYPTWVQWISPDQFKDKGLIRIIAFFVFHSPCEKLSCMRKSLAEYGWTTPWKKPYWLNRQLRQAASEYEVIYSAQWPGKMEEALEKAGLKENFPSDISHEKICIHNKQKNQFMSVFYHIRNAFAHGRVRIVDIDGECVFVLEDVLPSASSDKLKVTARMILYKSTLLKWIDIIEAGEKEYQKDLSRS